VAFYIQGGGAPKGPRAGTRINPGAFPQGATTESFVHALPQSCCREVPNDLKGGRNC
jgi:hypothetical protein